MKKPANVIMLPTDNKHSLTPATFKSGLFISKYGSHLRYLNEWYYDMISDYTSQHLYITSDEEIEEGDWILITSSNGDNQINKVAKIKKKLKPIYETVFPHKGIVGGINIFKKIIATTDSSLLIDKDTINYYKTYVPLGDIHLPQIPQSFIEEYITEYNKVNIIKQIMVEYEEELTSGNSGWGTDRFKLKLSKDNTIIISKSKNSWSREEVIRACQCAVINCTKSEGYDVTTFNEWIKENL